MPYHAYVLLQIDLRVRFFGTPCILFMQRRAKSAFEFEVRVFIGLL